MHINKSPRLFQINIPFELNDLFKSFFKTAKWNPTVKCWEVMNTTANENKLAKFANATEEAEAAQAALNQQEATLEEIEALNAMAAKLTNQANAIVASRGGQVELAQRLSNAKETLAAAKEAAASAAAEKHALVEANAAVLTSLLAAYTLNGKGVQAVVAMTAKAYNTRDRDTLDKGQAFLREVFDAVKTSASVEFLVLLEIARANINRPDRDRKWFAADMFSPEYVVSI